MDKQYTPAEAKAWLAGYDEGKKFETKEALSNAIIPVEKMREMLEVQGRNGTWDCSPYFHGMYNGMEFMLAMVEKREPVYRTAPSTWLEQEKSAPEPEPVAWMHRSAAGDVYFRRNRQDKVFNPQPLYLAPQQREWVGLTDEEMQGFGNDLLSPHKSIRDAFNAIEAKLKEKNR